MLPDGCSGHSRRTTSTRRRNAADQLQEDSMSFRLAHRDDCERTGGWQLVRRTLGLGAFGINIVDIPAGERIPEHDERERDQEEVFYVLSGNPTLLIDGEEHPAAAGTFARLDPEHSRTVINASE